MRLKTKLFFKIDILPNFLLLSKSVLSVWLKFIYMLKLIIYSSKYCIFNPLSDLKKKSSMCFFTEFYKAPTKNK